MHTVGTRVRQKVFRVERGARAEAESAGADASDGTIRNREIMAELKALRAVLEQRPAELAPVSAGTGAFAGLDPQQIAELQKLKTELDLIHAAINRTKQEIATLHISGFRGPQMARVTDELGAVVGGTEKATQTILAASEEIDQSANTLSALLRSAHEKGLTQDIQDRVIRIFEACNFQDLTGQRITKVLGTMKFIEQHIMRMIEIWGGLDALRDFAPEAIATHDAEEKLLHGPKLESDQGHASQNDIDALFA